MAIVASTIVRLVFFRLIITARKFAKAASFFIPFSRTCLDYIVHYIINYCIGKLNIYVIYRLGGPYSEKLPEFLVFHYTDRPLAGK